MLKKINHEKERENLRIKRSKWIGKIHKIVNKRERKKIEKQIAQIGKGKDDSKRIFKAIKNLNKTKPNIPLLIKEENQYTANKKQRVKDTINPCNCLLKNANFSIKTANN